MVPVLLSALCTAPLRREARRTAPRGLFLASVAGLLAAIPVLSIHSQSVKSATFDEPINLVYGIHGLATGDFSAPMDYGPLSRALGALSLRIFRVPVNYAPDTIPWVPGLLPSITQKVLYVDNDADELVFWGRMVFVLLQLLLALAVFDFSRRAWGRTGALVSLVLCALSPSLLAHGRLVTADFPVAAFLFLTFYFAHLVATRLTGGRALAGGLCLGLALLAKLSALFAIPILLLSFGGRAVLGRAWEVAGPRGHWSLRGRRKWLAAGASFGAFLCVALVVVWSFYGFRYRPWSADDPDRARKMALVAEFRSQNEPRSPAQRAALAVAEGLRVLPEPYLLAVRFTFKYMEHHLTFFLGERSIEGHWAYFPVAFLLKTPLATILLLLLTGLAVLRRRLRLNAVTALFLLSFPVLYFSVSLFSNLNLGQRHLLPIYPFLFVFAGGAGLLLTGSRLRIPVLGLLAWVAASALAIHPDYLAYFNEVAGGPRGGMRYLGDSNLDWGQDLKRLKPWMERNQVAHIKLGYFGTALPEYYGFSFEWLPSVGFANQREGTRRLNEGDYLAVGATCLQGFYFQDMDTYRFLDAFEPIDAIGHTLFIYHITREQQRSD